MIIRLLLGVAAWALAIAGVGAQPVMQWKFEVGKGYECERVATQKQTVELNGKTFSSNRQSTWLIRLDVIGKDAESARIRATLAKVEHHITPAVAEEMVDPKLDERMQGSTFEMTVTLLGQVTKFAGYEGFLKRLANHDTGKLKVRRATFSEAFLRQAFEDLFGPLPDKAVGKGDTWQREYVEPIPHFGALRSDVRYVYADTKDSHDQITYTIQSRYELPKDDMSVLFRITKGNLASDKATGSMVFDRSAGRLLQHDRSLRLRGTLTIEVMGRPLPMEFRSADEVKVRIKSMKP
jgi:hypothetical protein